MAKSRVYPQDDGSKVSFEFGSNGKLIGIKKDGTSLNPKSVEFEDLQDGDDALNAYNVNKFGGNIQSYEEIIDVDTNILIAQHVREEKKETNESFVEQDNITRDRNIAIENARPKTPGKTIFLSYPTDLDFKQDHFKITKYEYVRPDINQSKSQRNRNQYTHGNTDNSNYTPTVKRTVNVAGDGVIDNSKPLGSIFLPMPKATDVNGVEWGKSELTISGLAALGAANMATFGGRFLGGTPEEKKNEADAKKLIQNRNTREEDGTAFTEGASAIYTQTVSKTAGAAFGVELDADTVLARQGGRVLNPNAEMLFQGPVIRDFAFSFIMIARSQKEGADIRKIIRFLKLGMAPKFRTTTYLKAPDVFTLDYKNGRGKDDYLKTVNQFNPGGLALTTMNVDYAPNGYWSAYRDSQPVALKMDLNFTELRPIYQGDQAGTPEDSVGY